jgi:hypothetical protein
MCIVLSAKVVAIGVGIAAIVAGIFAGYLAYQQSIEQEYIDGVNAILSERNQIINEFMSDLLPRMETKQISVSDGKTIVSSLSNEADKLLQEAFSMNVPAKFKSAHPHLMQGLDHFSNAVTSTKDALQYTENALEAGQKLQTASVTVMGTIFGFDSLPDTPEMSDVRSNADAAKNTFNDAVNYLRQSEDELQVFHSMAGIKRVSTPSAVLDVSEVGNVTKEMLEECRELGIPEFSCSEQKILEKRPHKPALP